MCGKCLAQCSTSVAENRAGGWIDCPADTPGTGEGPRKAWETLCWGEEVSTKPPLKISGTRGVATGSRDSLGKDNLEMLGEATRAPAGQAGSEGLKQSLWRATPSPVLSLCPLTAPGVIARLPQPGLPERSTKQAAGPSAKNIMW